MAMTLITTNTSSNAASSSFTSGIDSTYKLYIFKFYDVNPATADAEFTFQVNATDGADYNDSNITSTFFQATQTEVDSNSLHYHGSYDLAESASFQTLINDLGNAADECCTGELFLFNPSNTTYVKHWYSRFQGYDTGGPTGGSNNSFAAGYINDTTAIDDIQFKMSSGNMDAVISMYGVG
jgi:hypothetical protein